MSLTTDTDIWPRKKLFEICDVVLGQSPPGHTYNTLGDGLPFFQGKAEFGDMHPTAVKWCSEPSKIALEDDVLLSVRAPVGPTNMATETCCIGRGLAAIRAKDEVLPKFILYWMRASAGQLSSQATGSTFAAISGSVVQNHLSPVPPLDQQRAIVAEIETQFARLDEAVASLQRAKARLKRYRASVLKAACEGRLVPTEAELARQEGRDYEPASVLLERIAEERTATGGAKRGRGAKGRTDAGERTDMESVPTNDAVLPEGWAWTTVATVLSEPLINGRSVPDATTGFPVLRLTAIHGGIVDTSQKKVGNWSANDASRFLISAGDFLVARGNGSLKLVGRGAIVSSEPEPVAFPDTLIRIRTNPKAVGARYLSAIWHSVSIRGQIERSARTTAGIYKINQQDLSNICIPIPPPIEQERIVIEVDRVASLIDQLEATVAANLKRTESLRQSVLRQAFSGRLVGRADT